MRKTASNKTLPGVDPSWGPSATPAQQARNILRTQKNEEKRQQQAAKVQQTAAAAARSTQNKGALQSALERFNLSPAASAKPAAPTARANATPANDLRERMLSHRANATPQRTPARTPDQKAADVGEQPRASRRGLSAVTNPANEFAGILGTGAPVGASAIKDLYDRAQASKANRKAADVAEQPTSWHQQQATPQVSAEVAASNARMAKALAKTTDLSTAARYLKDTLKTGGRLAQLEVKDLAQKLDAIAPGQGKKLATLSGVAALQNGSAMSDVASTQTTTTRTPDQKAADVGEQAASWERSVLNDETERLQSIINNSPATFNIQSNPNADSGYKIHEFSWLGDQAVQNYSNTIDRMAKKHAIDPDIVRSVMWAENARGHKFGLNLLADMTEFSDTPLPMNINKKTAAKLLGVSEDEIYAPDTNIEAGTVMLKRIMERVADPSDVSKIGSIWNFTGLEKTNDFGEFIGQVYKEKPWSK